jgi:hypothetical protein
VRRGGDGLAGIEWRDPPAPHFSRVADLVAAPPRRTPRPVLTIEIDRARRAIVQVHGLYNRAPTGKSWQIVQTWARREQLRMAC